MSSFAANSDKANPFKNANNQFLLKALFFELADDLATAIYTLKDKDHRGYRSLKQLYLAAGDPTEYLFATTALDGIDHWEALQSCEWFKPYHAKWRYELELKLRSEAVAAIIAEGASGKKNSFQANKYLAKEFWGQANSKGRPSKSEITKEASRLAQEKLRIDDDFDRIVTQGAAN